MDPGIYDFTTNLDRSSLIIFLFVELFGNIGSYSNDYKTINKLEC